MKKYLLIDGNNMSYRVFYVHKTLTHRDSPVGLLFGMFKNLVSLKKIYSDYIFVIFWDSKSKRRIAESEAGVSQGYLTRTYKSARQERSEETNEMFKDMFSQMDRLKEALNLINIQQVFKEGFEADDLINSYCKKIGKENEILVITSDKDYYQLLDDNISILEPIKKEMITKESFLKKYGISPIQWIDLGGITGDAGDSIEGAVGWGDVTSLKYLKQYGTMENVLEEVEKKEIKNKKELTLLSFKDRLKIAKSLKQMDVVEDLPEIEDYKENLNNGDLRKFFIDNGFMSLVYDCGFLIA